jgi:LysM repeat protein
MAAVIDLQTGLNIDDVAGAPRLSAPRGPSFRVIHGGRSDAGRRLRRMYLQRRLVAAAVVVLVVLAAVQVLGSAVGSLSASTSGPTPIAASTYEVTAGDTLWGIAARVAPDSDTRDVVQDIIDMNPSSDLARGTIRAGQVLQLPQG